MINEQKKSEITDLLYFTINREIEKKEKDINVKLVDECYELLRTLKSVKEISNDEICRKLEAMMPKTEIRSRKYKKFKIRLIAAIITVLLLMGFVSYTFYDELTYEIEQIFQIAKPGIIYRNEEFDYEISENSSKFSSIKELTDYLDTPIWIPTDIPKGYKLIYIDVTHFSENDHVFIVWEKKNYKIYYSADIYFSTTNMKNQSNTINQYISPSNHEYIISEFEGNKQATTLINNTYYTIKAKNIRLLKQTINSMKLYN